MFLWAFTSMLVAHWVVPGSWIAVRYSLAREIIYGTNLYYENAIVGLQLALLYLTFYRWLRPRLGTGLQMETVHLDWNDLRLPGLLFVISVILGLMVIT